MTMLAMGGTGMIGSLVVEEVAKRGARVRVLGRKQPQGGLPDGAEFVAGDVLDVDFMRGLLGTVSTVFVLNPGVADELARALLVLSLIEDVGIKRIVYLSMIGADRFANASRAAAKLAAEGMIARRALPTTILQPSAVFQNDAALQHAITRDHVYSTPLGGIGTTMVDARDLAEVAAIEMLRREGSSDPLPTETIEVVGPEAWTGRSMADLWTDVLGEPVTYAGDDLDSVERAMRQVMPAAGAYDLKLMFRGILEKGVSGQPGAHDRLVRMLGRPLRRYRDFAREMLVSDG